MSNKTRFTAVALLFGILSACGGTPPAEPAAQMLRLPAGIWSAHLTQSGGLVSVQLTVEISSDGHLTAADQRSGRSASRSLPPETMAELRRLITLTPIPSPGTPSAICMDCFIYAFELSSEAGVTRIQSDDASIGNSGAEALIQFMAKLRDAALQGQP